MASVESLESRQLLSAGQLDTSFGAGGALLFPASGATYATAVQGDGKILLVGSSIPLFGTSVNPASFYVERLNPNGTVDSTFGANGIVNTAFPTGSAASAVLIQPDGKIVVGGTEVDVVNHKFELARYNTDGSLDTSFGSAGKTITVLPNTVSVGQSLSMSLSSDGTIVAASQSTYFPPDVASGQADYTAFTVAHYNSDGALDSTFARLGILTQQIPERTNDYVATPAIGLAVETDGKVVVGNNFKSAPALWRYNVDGTPDRTFGQAGVAMLPIAGDSLAAPVPSATVVQVVPQPDGKILALGPAILQDQLDSLMERFNADGSIDTSFGNTTASPTGGSTIIPLGNGTQYFYRLWPDMLLQPDGKIVVAGSESRAGVVVNRYSANGVIDPTFQFTPYRFDADSLSGTSVCLNLTPGGNIILVDNPQLKSNSDNTFSVPSTGVLRIQDDLVATTASPATTTSVNVPAGGIDASFGVQGKAAIGDPTTVWTLTATQRTARAIVRQQDAKVLVAGSVGTVGTIGIGQIFVERLNVDGTVDTTFGTDGYVQTAVGNVSLASAIVVQPDGKIVVGGANEDSVTATTSKNFALVRYNIDGSLDTTFGIGGIVITNFAGNEEINALSMDGTAIVAAGSYFDNPDIGFHVARYLPDGSLDSSFNSTGELTTDLGPPTPDTTAFATSLLVLQNGSIDIGSHSGGHAAVYTYNADGSVPFLGGNSNVMVNPGRGGSNSFGAGTVESMTELSGGGVIAAAVEQDGVNTWINLFKVGNGQVDTFYGDDGVSVIHFADDPGSVATGESTTLPLDPTYASIYNVALATNGAGVGKIIVVGSRPTFDPTGAVTGPIGLRPFVQRFNADGTVDTTFVDSADPGFMPGPYFRGEVVAAAADPADGTILVATNNFAARASLFSDRFHDPSSPHWIGVTRYLTDPTAVTVKIPANGTDYMPAGTGGVGSPLPDGQLTASTTGALPARVLGGAHGTLRVLVKNPGATAFSGPVTIGVYSSSDATISADDTLLGRLTVPRVSLKAGATRSIVVPFTYAAVRPSGQYRILTSVTEVAQGTAAYFAVHKQSIQLTTPIVDLSLVFVPNKPAKFKAGKKGRVVIQIKNLGNAAAVGSYSIVLQGSLDATKDSADPVLARATLKAFRLPAKGVRRVTLNFSQVTSLGSAYTLIVTGTATTTVFDSNSSNESIQLAATVG